MKFRLGRREKRKGVRRESLSYGRNLDSSRDGRIVSVMDGAETRMAESREELIAERFTRRHVGVKMLDMVL